VMTAYVEDPEVQLVHEFDAFMRKPFNPEQLVKLAQELISSDLVRLALLRPDDCH
jgi:CheY-like chemotaxis protein